MDIVVKSVLNYIQGLDGHHQAILAGGAVRDESLGLEPKDYDLFIPTQTTKEMTELVQSIAHEFSVNPVLKTGDYDSAMRKVSAKGQVITQVYGMTVEGKDIDLIGCQEPDDEDFANEVIRNFDYGINMTYDTGSYVEDSNQYYAEDRGHAFMTLVNMPSIEYLPKAMERYNKFNKKFRERFGHDLKFRSVCLQVVSEEKFRAGAEKPYFQPNRAERVELIERVPVPPPSARDLRATLSGTRPILTPTTGINTNGTWGRNDPGINLRDTADEDLRRLFRGLNTDTPAINTTNFDDNF
jgi:hypothetical protein